MKVVHIAQKNNWNSFFLYRNVCIYAVLDFIDEQSRMASLLALLFAGAMTKARVKREPLKTVQLSETTSYRSGLATLT